MKSDSGPVCKKKPFDFSHRLTKQQWSWALYDFANSSFSTVILTFVYSLYFAKAIVGDPITGTALWSYAIATSGFFVAILAPIFGAAADHYGVPKRFLRIFALTCIIATALLWWGPIFATLPQILVIMLILAVANLGLELSLVFYNAMLPHIVEPENIGRVSGKAWALGYLGGLISLLLVFVLFVGIGKMEPLLQFQRHEAEHIRASALFVALWYMIFLIPILIWCPDAPRTGLKFKEAVKRGLRELRQSFSTAKHNRNLLLFVIASAIYRDGLVTLFAIGGLYAAGTFSMSFYEIMLFGIMMNLAAGIGAFVLSSSDDIFGSKTTVLVSLVGLIIFGGATLFIDSKTTFMMVASFMALFIGPVQAASRTMISRLAPRETLNQSYGIYAFTGKSIAFLGPLLFGLATTAFESQRAGMSIILGFWVIGFIILLFVNEQKHSKS